MTLEELHDNLDALAALPPDWDHSYKGTSGMVVSKAAIAHARTVGAALLAAGHTSFGAFPCWEDTQPDYLVALEADGWHVMVDPDGVLVATVWRQATPEDPTELDIHCEQREFPAGATDALLAFIKEHAHE